MRKIRVLIADDEVIVRRLISEVIEEEPAMQVAVAPNSQLALAKIPQVNPDIVLLDLGLDGMADLQPLARIRDTYPDLPVIILCSTREKTASQAMEALALGAHDYVAKPENLKDADAAKESIRQDLVPKIKTFCPNAAKPEQADSNREKKREAKPEPSRIAVLPRSRAAQNPQRVDILAIGVSTGGPNALAQLMPRLPADFPAPIVIVQHMPPYFTKLLAERLNALSSVPVKEAVPGEILKAGEAWIAPGNYHMTLKRDGGSTRIQTHQGPPVNSCRPAVDVLFKSVAETYGAHSLAVVLTGMGQDGLRGCEEIYEAGGQILAQDEATSVVWGMPGFVSRAGLADKVLPLCQLGAEINKRASENRAEPASAWAKNSWFSS